MEADLTRLLNETEAKRRALNIESDLSKECDSIAELDKRVSALLVEVQRLKDNVSEQSAFMASNCDKLAETNKALERTSRINELSVSLGNLNRLCRKIDKLGSFTNRIFSASAQISPLDSLEDAQPQATSNENASLLMRMVLDTCNEFENNYRPMSVYLEKRRDLPYVGYWNRVIQTRDYISRVYPEQVATSACRNKL